KEAARAATPGRSARSAPPPWRPAPASSSCSRRPCPWCAGSARCWSWVSPSLGAVRDIDTLQKETGVAGEVDVLVEGRDLTDPKVIAWMRDYQNDVLL